MLPAGTEKDSTTECPPQPPSPFPWFGTFSPQVAEMAVVEQSVVRSLPTNHPNIVRFHDAGISKAENEIRYYILSEYCPSNVLKKMSNAAVRK